MVMPIRKANNNTYSVDLSLGVDRSSGKRIRRTKRGFLSLKEAKEYETNQLSLFYQRKRVISSQTIQEITSEYMGLCQHQLKRTSLDKKERTFRLHILPRLGNIRIDQFDKKDALAFKQYLMNKTFSDSYKKEVFMELSALMNHCVKYDYIPFNPVRFLNDFKSVKKEMKFWSVSQFHEFIQYIDNDHLKMYFWLLMATGMRRGEAHALYWSDIDLNHQTIRVNKNSTYVSGDGYQITTPKTVSSNRVVHIDKFTIGLIKAYKGLLKKNGTYSEEYPIFWPEGIPIPRETIRRYFKQATKMAGLPEIRLHDLRHSHVSLMVSLGVEYLEISRKVGHSNISTTMNTYAHLYSEKQKSSAQLIGKALEIDSSGVKLESLENYTQNKNANFGVITGNLPDNILNGATDGTRNKKL
jgi:integrase